MCTWSCSRAHRCVWHPRVELGVSKSQAWRVSRLPRARCDRRCSPAPWLVCDGSSVCLPASGHARSHPGWGRRHRRRSFTLFLCRPLCSSQFVVLCSPVIRGAFRLRTGGETRTPDARLWRPLLYRLSYARMKLCLWGKREPPPGRSREAAACLTGSVRFAAGFRAGPSSGAHWSRSGSRARSLHRRTTWRARRRSTVATWLDVSLLGGACRC